MINLLDLEREIQWILNFLSKSIKESFWPVLHQDQDNLEDATDTFWKERSWNSIKRKS